MCRSVQYWTVQSSVVLQQVAALANWEVSLSEANSLRHLIWAGIDGAVKNADE